MAYCCSYIVRPSLAVHCTNGKPARPRRRHRARPHAPRSRRARSSTRSRTRWPRRSPSRPRHEHVVAKAAEKIAEKAARHEHIATGSSTRRRLDRSRSTSACSTSGPDPSRRPRRPRFTRDEIAAAAMRIADAEGFDAVSMRRIATELDAGTMTLYHYVRTKDELLALVTDAVMGEVVVPDPTSRCRRTGARPSRIIAERTRAALHAAPVDPRHHRRPADRAQQRAPLRPVAAGRRVACRSRWPTSSTSSPRSTSTCSATACMERNNLLQADDTLDERDDRLRRTTSSRPVTTRSSRRWPRRTASSRAGPRSDDHLRDPTRFARNLRRLLDGIEADLSPR